LKSVLKTIEEEDDEEEQQHTSHKEQQQQQPAASTDHAHHQAAITDGVGSSAHSPTTAKRYGSSLTLCQAKSRRTLS
jgi:hypothetical protein